MNPSLSPSVTVTPEGISPGNSFRLTGRWLQAGQVAWLILFVVCVFLWVAGAFEWYDNLRRPCTDPVHTGWPQADCEPYYLAITDLHLTPDLFAGYTAGLYFLAGLPHFVLSVLLIRRRPDSASVLLLAMFLAVIGAMGKWMNPLPLWALALKTPFDLNWLSTFITFFWAGLSPLILCTFADGKFTPRWIRWVCLVWLVLAFLSYFFGATPLNFGNWPEPLPQVITMTVVGVILFSMVYRYCRVANQTQQQQMKWFLAALTLLILIYVADFAVFNIYPLVSGGQDLIGAGMPSVAWELTEGTIWAIAEALFAVCVGFSIFRFQLYGSNS